MHAPDACAGLSHAERRLSLAEGRRLARTKKPSRFHKQAFSHAEGSVFACRRKSLACTNKPSRLHKEALAHPERSSRVCRKPSRIDKEASRLQKGGVAHAEG